MEETYKYYAFISYKSEDVEWAIWLQHELEHYHLPSSFNGREDIQQALRPVFRDLDELSAGNLPEQIKQALKDSKNLIVICSPQSSKSKWVNDEVKTFISLGRINNIFPFIVEGKSPADFYPEVLRQLPDKDERLGGDVRLSGRDAAFVKIVAGMLGLPFDSLWQRYEKEKAEEERKQREKRDNLLRLQSRLLAEKALALVSNKHAYLARKLALYALPTSLEQSDRPLTSEAEEALRYAIRQESGELEFNTNSRKINFENDNSVTIGDYRINLTDGSYDHFPCCYKNQLPRNKYRLDNYIIDKNEICYFSCFDAPLIIVYDLKSATTVCSFTVGNVRKNVVLLNQNNDRLVYASIEEIRFWDLTKKIELCQINANAWRNATIDNANNRFLWNECGKVMSLDLNEPNIPINIIDSCTDCEFFKLSDNQEFLCIKPRNQSRLDVWNYKSFEYQISLEINGDIENFEINSHYIIVSHKNLFKENTHKTDYAITIYDILNNDYVYQRTEIRNIIGFKFNPQSKWLIILITGNGICVKFEKIKDKCYNVLSDVSNTQNQDPEYPILDFTIIEDEMLILDKTNFIVESLNKNHSIISKELNQDSYYQIKPLSNIGYVLLSKHAICISKYNKNYLFKSPYVDDRTLAINPNVSTLIISRSGKFAIFNIDTLVSHEYKFEDFPNIHLEENECFFSTKLCFIDESKCVFVHNKGFSIWEFDSIRLCRPPQYEDFDYGVSVRTPFCNATHNLLYSKSKNQLYFINDNVIQVVDLYKNKLSDSQGIDLSQLGKIQSMELSDDEYTMLVTGRTDGSFCGNYFGGTTSDFFLLIDTSKWRIVDRLKPNIEFTACHFGVRDESILFADVYGSIQSYEYLPLQKLIHRETERLKDTPLSDEEKRQFYIE